MDRDPWGSKISPKNSSTSKTELHPTLVLLNAKLKFFSQLYKRHPKIINIFMVILLVGAFVVTTESTPKGYSLYPTQSTYEMKSALWRMILDSDLECIQAKVAMYSKYDDVYTLICDDGIVYKVSENPQGNNWNITYKK